MNIALVILHADPTRGGAERYTTDLAAGLVEHGHSVSLLACTFFRTPDGVKKVVLAAGGWTRAGRYRRFLASLDSHFASTKYDVVHAMLPAPCDIYHPHAGIAREAYLRGHQNRSTGRDRLLALLANRFFNGRRAAMARVEEKLLTSDNPPRVICLSNVIRRVLVQNYPNLPEDRLITIFNSVDLKRFNPGALPDPREKTRNLYGLLADDVVGLLMAQDFERKGLRQAILALSQLRNPKFKLLVAGRPDPAEYKKLAAKEGVTDRVFFVGPTDSPASLYRAADYFVLPTRADPCSLVVLEALAMGLPVISTAANGACEIMTDGIHGRILPDASRVDELAAAVLEMSQMSKVLQMSAAATELRTRLSFERHIQQIVASYTQSAQKLDKISV